MLGFKLCASVSLWLTAFSRMNHAYLLLLACLAAAPTCANAAEWVKIHSHADGDQFFYDNTKLFIHDNEITYWKKVVFATPQTFKGKLAGSGLYRERIHCAEHTLKTISYLLYAPTGEPVEYVSTESETTPIIPDSLGDVFEKSLCQLVWKKQEEARLKAEAERIKADMLMQKQEEERLRAEAEAAKVPAPEIKIAPPATPPPAATPH